MKSDVKRKHCWIPLPSNKETSFNKAGSRPGATVKKVLHLFGDGGMDLTIVAKSLCIICCLL